MIGLFWLIDIFLSMFSSLLMGLVFAFYAKRAKEIKSKFAVGLAVFSGSLFSQSLITSYVYYMFAKTYTSSLAIPLMAITLLETVGFLSLVYVVEQ